jgi:transketolase C-terminal domain/subunit
MVQIVADVPTGLSLTPAQEYHQSNSTDAVNSKTGTWYLRVLRAKSGQVYGEREREGHLPGAGFLSSGKVCTLLVAVTVLLM